MRVNLYATLRQAAGVKNFDLDLPAGSASLQECLRLLTTQLPALVPQLFDSQGQLYEHIHLFVNRKDVTHLAGGLSMMIVETETLDIFPPVAGG